MKKIISSILLLLSSFFSFAQTATFDIATYKIPKGWTKSTKEGLVTFSTSNEAKGSFCIINLYASSATKGTAQQEFEKDWKQYAATPFNISDALEIDTTSDDDGREVIVGSANFKSGSLTGAALLYTFVGFGRTTDILFFTNDESHQKDIEDFLTTIELKKNYKAPASTTSVTPAPVKTTTSTTSTTNTFSKPANNLVGIWNGMNINTSDFNFKSSGDPIWLIFYNNGKVGNVLPNSINSNNMNANDLGTYSISGNKASLRWFAGTPNTDIIFKNNDQIQVIASTGDQNYFRSKSVDGAKIEGSWSTYANPNSAEINGSTPVSLITFSKNGTFKDYGIFSEGIEHFSSVKTMPGNGTYSINNYTISLQYSNGIVKQSTFIGFLGSDVNSKNNSIFIDGHKLRKQD